MLVPRRGYVSSTSYQMSVFLKELDDESHQDSGPQVVWPGPMFTQFSPRPREASQVQKSPPTYRFFSPTAIGMAADPASVHQEVDACKMCIFFWPLDVSFFVSDAFHHITSPTSRSSSSPRNSPFFGARFPGTRWDHRFRETSFQLASQAWQA